MNKRERSGQAEVESLHPQGQVWRSFKPSPPSGVLPLAHLQSRSFGLSLPARAIMCHLVPVFPLSGVFCLHAVMRKVDEEWHRLLGPGVFISSSVGSEYRGLAYTFLFPHSNLQSAV